MFSVFCFSFSRPLSPAHFSLPSCCLSKEKPWIMLYLFVHFFSLLEINFCIIFLLRPPGVGVHYHQRGAPRPAAEERKDRVRNSSRFYGYSVLRLLRQYFLCLCEVLSLSIRSWVFLPFFGGFPLIDQHLPMFREATRLWIFNILNNFIFDHLRYSKGVGDTYDVRAHRGCNGISVFDSRNNP